MRLLKVHRIRGAPVERTVSAPSVVESEVLSHSVARRGRCFKNMQVHVLVLHAASQSLDEDVVHPATLTIHIDLDAGIGEYVDEPFARESAAWVGKERERENRELKRAN